MDLARIKLLTECKDYVLLQLQTMEQAERRMEDTIVTLESRLEHTIHMNLGLTVGDTSLEDLLQKQIDYEKDNLDNFRTYKQPREQMYNDQLAKVEALLKVLSSQ